MITDRIQYGIMDQSEIIGVITGALIITTMELEIFHISSVAMLIARIIIQYGM